MKIEGTSLLAALFGPGAAGPEIDAGCNRRETVKPDSTLRPTLLKRLAIALAGAAFVTFGTVGISNAATVTFGDRGAFDAAAPGLALEDFESANVPANSSWGFPAPLDSMTNNAVFSAGDIQGGIQFVDNPGGHLNGLIAVGDGYLGAASKKLTPYFLGDALDIVFTDAVNAVGFDVASLVNPSNIVISVFGAGGLLDAAVFAGNTIDSFFGVISDTDLITSIRVSSGFNALVAVDNVAFGMVDQTDDVPEPTGLALLGIGLGLLGFARRRAVPLKT